MKIGKYEVVGKLGEGGMGTVYSARDPLLDRLVAIKVISSEQLDDTSRTLFEREAKAIALLSHPNIVSIFEFDFWEGRPYIVMELLKGLDLHDYLDATAVSLLKKLEIVVQVCSGLAQAHSQGMIHRDVKPPNIFITENGSVKITDFGVARLSASTMTQDMILGTPEFIAPERWSSGEIDARSDIFSVGVVLYWLLTGDNPFAGEDVPRVFYKIMNTTPQPPDLSLPEAPSNLLQYILDRSLSKSVDDRYQDASTMAADLKTLIGMLSANEMQAEPHAAKADRKITTQRPPTMKEPAQAAPSKQSPVFSASETHEHQINKAPVLFSLILLISGLVGAFFFWKRSSTGNTVPEKGILAATAPLTELGVVCSSEKRAWMEKSLREFAATSEGQTTHANLISMGSLDAANAVLAEDRRINAWTPASQIYEGFFFQEWQKKHSRSPVVTEKNLAVTPMVFLMWESRYKEFMRRYKTLNFSSLTLAMNQADWQVIAGKPEWGAFRFGFADPTRSNSGLAALLSMAHEYFKNPVLLSVKDLSDPGFQKWIQSLHKHNPRPMKEAAALTERMMLLGPPGYDVVFTYENLAIELMKKAAERWEPLYVSYPAYNVWSENPFYVLDVPWTNSRQKESAAQLLDFLLSPGPQKDLIQFSFRPGNPEISIDQANSPFQQFHVFGIRYSEGTAVDPPDASTVEALLQAWIGNN